MNSLPRIAVIAAGLALGVVGCSDRSNETPAPADPDKIVRDDVYEDVLGVIAALPVAGQPGMDLKIHHEHLPEFKTKEGPVNVSPDGVPGMKSMIMPFPPADGLDLGGLEIGDPVRFTFVVHWGGSPAWEVTAIEELPAGTEIDFANKATGTPTETTADHDHDGHDHDGHDGHDHGSP